MIQLPKQHSFFLFGPRLTGKSTLLKATFSGDSVLYYDLLRRDTFTRLMTRPGTFRQEIDGRKSGVTHVIVDEIQRVPDLLNEIHSILEDKAPPYFCMSGSSARKLKRTRANLLAGRAWTYHLYPLTHTELGGKFSLEKALHLGTLPKVYLAGREEAEETLRAYVDTYLREEIEAEAVARNLGGFMRFLTLAGDQAGRLINYSNIARETGLTHTTVRDYFQILEDTLTGFILFPYSKTTVKRLVKQPKFYFFDTGVERAVAGKLALELLPKTLEYGRAFEHFLIAEVIRLSRYQKKDYRFSFYHSAAHAEVDLAVETPKGKVYALEIKATENPDSSSLKGLKSFSEISRKAVLYCASLAPRRRKAGEVTILPWQETFEALGI